MRHTRFYPRRQSDQLAWLTNFANKLPLYAVALGLTAEQVAAAVADCGWLQYFLRQWLPELRAFKKAATSAHAEAQCGTGTDAQIIPTFIAPTPHDGVAAVAPGALNRVFVLVRGIKNSGKCDDIIAADLGIAGAEASRPDLSAVQPILKLFVSGGRVHIKWNWQGLRNWLSSC